MKNKLDEMKPVEEINKIIDFEQNKLSFCIFEKNKLIRRVIQTFKYRK